MSKSQKERVKNSFIENRPVDLASPTSSSPHSIPSTHPQSSSSHSSHPPTSPKHLPSPPHSPHHKTSPHNVPSPLTLPEADVEQEKGLDMPDEILAVVNEITWKNHYLSSDSPFNQFITKTPENDDQDFHCTICKQDYNEEADDQSKRIVQLKTCEDKFHLECIAEHWGKGKKDCPNCRRKFDFKHVEVKEECREWSRSRNYKINFPTILFILYKHIIFVLLIF
uniref:RING-type domain-containing protein n=1 Tax=Meloidogyne incognita TaxID=6306 RepID=A0A914NFR6_MELIC